MYSTIHYYQLISENIFLANFYISYQNFCFFFKVMDLLPECFLLFCILYSLSTISSNKNNGSWQLYRWLGYLLLVFIMLCLIPCGEYHETNLLFGITMISCWYTKISKMVILFLTIVVLYSSKRRLVRNAKIYVLELPLIVGFSVFFLLVLTSTYDFFGLYLALEGLSLTLYVLAGILNASIISIESAIKYFSLGAISSGFLLFGISLLFGIIGSLDFLEVQLFLGNQDFNSVFEFKCAILLIFFGLFFKLSAFPCHWWVADVYEGIWTPVTAFFSIVVKVGLFMFFLRIVYNVFFNVIYIFQPIIIFVSVGSMFVGTLGALKQVKVKRFIAYTSISQVGFLMLGVSSCSLGGLIASLVYLYLYSLMSLGFFILILNIEHIVSTRNMIYLSEFYSFWKHSPRNACYLTVILFSMAGIPPLGGFFCKFLVYSAAIDAKLDMVVFFSLLLSTVSTYYYLNFIHYVYFVKFKVYRIYFFWKNKTLYRLLDLITGLLLYFFIYSPIVLHFATTLALSCLWPMNYY